MRNERRRWIAVEGTTIALGGFQRSAIDSGRDSSVQINPRSARARTVKQASKQKKPESCNDVWPRGNFEVVDVVDGGSRMERGTTRRRGVGCRRQTTSSFSPVHYLTFFARRRRGLGGEQTIAHDGPLGLGEKWHNATKWSRCGSVGGSGRGRMNGVVMRIRILGD